MQTLGQTLKASRELNRFTLRQVEEATAISNAYLSQLENDKIKKPSANVLYKLANLYRISLNSLLQAGGIIEKTNNEESKLFNSFALSSDEDSLSKDEKDELLKYLEYLRHKKKNG